MNYQILIHSNMTNTEVPLENLQRVRILLQENHHITSVFFYDCAVRIAQLTEVNELKKSWLHLSHQYSFELILCSQACEKYQIEMTNGFCIAGLGRFFETLKKSDQLIQFH